MSIRGWPNWLISISRHVPQTRIGGVYDITTQIPVIYILESLGRKLARKIS